MMIDMSIITEHFVLIVMLACLIVGYFLKNATCFKWVSNNDIPVVLAVVGAVINSIYSGLNLESIIYGALMGLASTGFHQAFKKWVENVKTTKGE